MLIDSFNYYFKSDLKTLIIILNQPKINTPTQPDQLVIKIIIWKD